MIGIMENVCMMDDQSRLSFNNMNIYLKLGEGVPSNTGIHWIAAFGKRL